MGGAAPAALLGDASLDRWRHFNDIATLRDVLETILSVAAYAFRLSVIEQKPFISNASFEDALQESVRTADETLWAYTVRSWSTLTVDRSL